MSRSHTILCSRSGSPFFLFWSVLPFFLGSFFPRDLSPCAVVSCPFLHTFLLRSFSHVTFQLSFVCTGWNWSYNISCIFEVYSLDRYVLYLQIMSLRHSDTVAALFTCFSVSSSENNNLVDMCPLNVISDEVSGWITIDNSFHEIWAFLFFAEWNYICKADGAGCHFFSYKESICRITNDR